MDDCHGVLPVAQVSGQVLREYKIRADAQIPPADAQEYMWRVRYEADNIPDVTTAEITISNTKPNSLQALFLPDLPIYPSEYALTTQARMQVLSEFADLRQYLVHVEATLVSRQFRTDNMVFPKMSEEAQWRAFFLQNPPVVKILLQMDQVLTQRLIHTILNWLDDETDDGSKCFSRLRGVWLYGLLARLEKPLVAEMDACVRQIFRWCWMTRHESTNEAERESLNVLVCICGFFGQGEEFPEDCGSQSEPAHLSAAIYRGCMDHSSY